MAFDPLSFAQKYAANAQQKTGGFNVQEFLLKQGIQPKADLSTTEGLVQTAERAGLGAKAAKIVEPTQKLSALQRLGKGLGAFNPAEAILTGTEKGVGAGLGKYVSGVAKGIGSAITGTDYEGDRRYFSEVAEKLGVKNGLAKFGIGFLGDVLLDPTTYFGGAMARGLKVVAKGAGETVLKTVGKAAPQVEEGLRLAGTGLQDALGRAFVYAYGASKGAKEDVLSFLSKTQRARLGIAASNLDRLGAGTLSKAQSEELALRMIAGKRAEFVAREAGGQVLDADTLSKDLSERFGGNVTITEQPDSIRIHLIELPKEKQGQSIGSQIISETKKLAESTGKKITAVPSSEFGTSREGVESFLKKNGFSPAEEQGIGIWEYSAPKQSTVKDVARTAALEGASPEMAQLIEQQIGRGKRFAENIGLENPYETYFPFIKKDKVNAFLKESYGLKVGSEGYRKQFKNLLTNENLELDPAKAFFTRESQIVTDNMTRDFLSGYVKKYGKPLDAFKDADEAAKAGFQLIKEKGLFGKQLGYVSKGDAALIRDSLAPEFQTLNMLAKATGFDAVTSLFKRSVTGLFAPFHVRNFASGIIQNFEVLGKDALNPKNIAVGQKIAYLMAKGEKLPAEAITIGGKTSTLRELVQPFVDRFSGDTFYSNDFLTAVDNSGQLKQLQGAFSKEALKTTVKTAGLGQEATPFKVARAIGQFIEHQQKATAYITALGQGKKVDEALRLAEAAGFDYRALTRFESQILRRIIPFYSFTRKNIELQLKTLGESPERINQVLRFFGNIGQQASAEERQNLPDFIRESLGVKLKDTPQGLKQYISSFGTPIEAFTQLFSKNPILRTMSMFNPLIKVPIELGIGKDSFRQRDLKDVYTANEYKMAPQFIKDLLEIKEVEKPVYERRGTQLVKVGTKTQYVADPTRLLVARSLFTSRGVSYLDQVFGNDLYGFVKFLKTTTGIKPQQVDIEAQKYYKTRDQQRELEDLLIRHGVVKEFRNVYTPKQ